MTGMTSEVEQDLPTESPLRPLVTHIYTADPSARVFDGVLYVYPSHDVDVGVPEDDDGEHFATKAEARAAVFQWIVWYNTTRLHSALDYRAPIEYEQHLTKQLLAA